MTDEEKAAAEAAETKESAEGGDEFDKERALKTIKAQRESEKALKATVAEKEAKLAEYEKADAEKAEAEKGLETKLAEAQGRIAELESQVAETEVKSDFVTKAKARGYADPGLAFIAAKDEGVLGELDPSSGKVGVHDFDKLEERFPALAGEAREERELGSGDAGARGHRGKRTVGSQFNDAIRDAF